MTEKPIGEFYKRTKAQGGLQQWCKDCAHTYRLEHKEHNKRRYKGYTQRVKSIALGHYSGGIPHCAHCGFADMRALSIDHINGGGTKHNKAINSNIYRWLIKNDFPPGYQTLCMNCQFIKREENGEMLK